MTTASEEALKLDLQELRDLRVHSSRQRVQDFLDLQIRRLETELAAAAAATTDTAAIATKTSRPVGGDGDQQQRGFTAEIKTYAWDQSDKYFKLYISEGMSGVGALPKDRVAAEFGDTSVRLRVLGLNGRDHELSITRLYGRILPAECSVRVKSDQIVVMLRKAAGSTWAYVTEQERRAKEQKKAKPKASPEDEADPSSGLMSLMRQMYEDGDDDMKRTIAKAWTESQNKRTAGE